jgi:hypothetical protein
MLERVIALIMAAGAGGELTHRHWVWGIAMLVLAAALNEADHHDRKLEN